MIEYPNKLDKIFDKLNKNGIKPIIVGGYVRDWFLKKTNKDIDIELYGVHSLQIVQEILQEFGKVNNVGKSFGVCKLNYYDLELDFSLPRKENKTAKGHKGFDIIVDTSLDFATAASRRDFTINAMGFDVIEKKLLDPFDGKADLEQKILKAVNTNSFSEDPLRVLRIMQFGARFELRVDCSLLKLAQNMIQNNVLNELPKERIFMEFEKLFLKSKKISYGIVLLQKMGGFDYFQELSTLDKHQLAHILQALDYIYQFQLKNKAEIIILSFALLSLYFTYEQVLTFMDRFTNNKKIVDGVLHLLFTPFDLEKIDNYSIYKLSTQTNIEFYSLFLRAKTLHKKEQQINRLVQKAKSLGVLNKKLPPLVEGKDLIKLGLQPSKEFSKILDNTYDAQMKEIFSTKEKALQWVQNTLLSK